MTAKQRLDDVRRRKMLGDFLRTRRARLRPSQAGLPDGTRRRTPGLRREEVAELANISLEWYTWLEQGRDIQVSAGVLTRVAQALRLSADEQLYLSVLATPSSALPPRLSADLPDLASEQLVAALPDTPAYLTDHRMDIKAWNRAARIVFGELPPSVEPNLLQLLFLHPPFRERFPDWHIFAEGTVATFRMTLGRHPTESHLTAFAGDLARRSAEFQALWARHDVQGVCAPHRQVDHPLLGCLDFDVLSLQVGADPDLRWCLYVPTPDTSTATRLRIGLRMERITQHDTGDGSSSQERASSTTQ